MTTDVAVSTGDAAPAVRSASPSGIVPKDIHREVAWFYIVGAAVLIAAGVVIPFVVHDGVWLGVMTIMGSFIIIALLSAAAVPHLREAHH